MGEVALALLLAADQIPEFMILQRDEIDEGRLLGFAEVSEAGVEKTRQRDIELEQGTAYATPAQAFVISTLHRTARLTIMSLILPIALVGLRPFGQTSTQCMMV